MKIKAPLETKSYTKGPMGTGDLCDGLRVQRELVIKLLSRRNEGMLLWFIEGYDPVRAAVLKDTSTYSVE